MEQQHNPQPPKVEKKNHHFRNALGIAACFGVAAGTMSACLQIFEDALNRKPSMILEGALENDGKPFIVRGGVFFECGDLTPDEVLVTASIRTVVDVPGDHQAPQGRIYEVRTTTGDDNCADAVASVKAHPGLIMSAYVDVITGWEQNVVGDGSYSRGENYNLQFDEAIADGVPTYQLTQ